MASTDDHTRPTGKMMEFVW